MSEPRVSTFFYGSFINLDVLAEVDYVPSQYEVAHLDGYDIRIQPLANIVRSDNDRVYGIVALATHVQLERLYRQEWVGVYLPHPTLVTTEDDNSRPALSYIAPSMAAEPPADDYVDRIVGPARRHGFPQWYIERLERFRA